LNFSAQGALKICSVIPDIAVREEQLKGEGGSKVCRVAGRIGFHRTGSIERPEGLCDFSLNEAIEFPM
jgi:hypothetical protein